MSMKELGTGPDPIDEELRSHSKQEASRIEMLAKEKGLRRLSDVFPGIWVLKKKETSETQSDFFTTTREKLTGREELRRRSRFFTQRYDKEGGVLFQEHNIRFPIEDPTQLLTAVKGFDALYAAHEGSIAYDRNDPTLFIQFIDSFVGDKRSQPKS